MTIYFAYVIIMAYVINLISWLSMSLLWLRIVFIP